MKENKGYKCSRCGTVVTFYVPRKNEKGQYICDDCADELNED